MALSNESISPSRISLPRRRKKIAEPTDNGTLQRWRLHSVLAKATSFEGFTDASAVCQAAPASAVYRATARRRPLDRPRGGTLSGTSDTSRKARAGLATRGEPGRHIRDSSGSL